LQPQTTKDPRRDQSLLCKQWLAGLPRGDAFAPATLKSALGNDSWDEYMGRCELEKSNSLDAKIASRSLQENDLLPRAADLHDACQRAVDIRVASSCRVASQAP
jgi:hypothetical protein